MCLIVFDWQPATENGPLLTLAANRDEFFRRTSAPLSWWEDRPGVLAGRDLEANGTWMGVSRDGRFAALTNFRAPFAIRALAPSRGKLVADFLSGPRIAPLDFLAQLAGNDAIYNGFNLLIGDWRRRELAYFCNRPGDEQSVPDAPQLVTPGMHGLSNGRLDTVWPKLVNKRSELGTLLTYESTPPLDALIDIMRDTRTTDDASLPRTGIPLERERALSAPFIETPEYGTRGTTALRVSVKESTRYTVEIKERSDDDGSHRIVRPGHFERAFTFEIVL